jgi:hypothetical protein
MIKKPAKTKLSVLGQVCKLIPGHLVAKLARKHGVDKRARTFTPWSHVVSLLYAQLTHAIGLNDVCDGLRHHCGLLGAIRGAVAPARNTLSHANKTRDSNMMEELFWSVLEHLQAQRSNFGLRYKGLPRRFKRTIYAIDSSTIALVANCMDWAKHRRRKAAAKLHMRLDLQSFLPRIAIVEEAAHHDNRRAVSLCAGLKPGEIVVFDKAYIDLGHLFELAARGVFWVTRAKDNMSFRVKRRLKADRYKGVLKDQIIELKGAASRMSYPIFMRRVVAEVQICGKTQSMVFLTNNFDWAATSVTQLYQARWAIEVFFKQIKQTLKLAGFIGYSKRAIQWQIWAALLVWLLARFQAYLSKWPHSFTRLVALIRSHAWERISLMDLLLFHGTACGPWRMMATPHQAYLPGLHPR